MADEGSDDEVEAPKVVKPKRQQTEAQKENFRKALAARAANVAKRNETKDERIINKKLTTLATKAEKLELALRARSDCKAKIPPKVVKTPIVKEILTKDSDEESDEEEPEIVIIKKAKPKKKKRIVVVEPESESDDEPEEVIQKPKPKPKPRAINAVSTPLEHVVVPRVNNLRFY